MIIFGISLVISLCVKESRSVASYCGTFLNPTPPHPTLPHRLWQGDAEHSARRNQTDGLFSLQNLRDEMMDAFLLNVSNLQWKHLLNYGLKFGVKIHFAVYEIKTH